MTNQSGNLGLPHAPCIKFPAGMWSCQPGQSLWRAQWSSANAENENHTEDPVRVQKSSEVLLCKIRPLPLDPDYPPTSSLPPAAYLQPLQPPEPCLQHAPPPSTSGPLYFLLWTPGTSTWLSGSLPSGLTSMSPQRRTLPYLPTLIHP